MTIFVPRRYRLARDSFEARIENTITRPDDLYDLDGETLFRFREGCIETGDEEALFAEDWS
ncbi:MAG: hypothetical protein QOI12_165 [Alphaproteobacteria bacterium]|jgi:hypothetical protein|nr:hypothetical protein [Alphaproteobacteria bacterium]